MGLFTAAVARLQGASSVLVAGMTPSRLAFAAEHYADRVVDLSQEELLPVVKQAIPEAILFADVSTYDEAVWAVEHGADIVGPTLYGYTRDTESIESPDLREFARMCRDLKDEAYVIMEGHLYTPEDAMKCIFLGAHAVVVGSAITRPHLTARRFVDLLSGYQNNWRDAEKSKH